jgi:hypothetical protein
LFDGFLGGEHHERLVSGNVLSPIVTWRSCIASRRALWTLAGARLNLVGEDDIGRNQTFLVVNPPSFGL